MKREDIVGHTLVQIVQKFTWDEDGVDFAMSYYQLDNGIAFILLGDKEPSAEKPALSEISCQASRAR